MPDRTRQDAVGQGSWQAGEAYDLFAGRWSRALAIEFIEWLNPLPGCEWLDVGCGTGALTEGLLARAVPSAIVAIEPSEDFLAQARRRIRSDRVSFRQGRAEALPVARGSCDAVGAGLVLDVVDDRPKALAEMRRAVRPGGLVGFTVWDHPGGGLPFLDAFWQAAQALDPAAAGPAEARRLPFCTQGALTALAGTAGLGAISSTAIGVPALFRDFDELWRAFSLGGGAASSYRASLAPAAREQLRERLRDSVPAATDGTITLEGRAWAVQGLSG